MLCTPGPDPGVHSMTQSTGKETGHLAQDLESLADRMLQGEPEAHTRLEALLGEVNAIDLARAMSRLKTEHAAPVFDRLDEDRQATVLAEAEPELQAFLLIHVGERGAYLVKSLDPDDAADVLETLDDAERRVILDALHRDEARELEELAEYGPETVGGLMTPEFVAVHPENTAEQVLGILRESADQAETITNIYVTEEGRMAGVFSIRDLIRAQPDRRVRDFMTTEVTSIRPTEDREEALRRMETYHLSPLPVVDAGQRLLGIVTFDDALTAMEQEASEDVLTMAGSGTVFSMRRTVVQRVQTRLPWLCVTLLGGLGGGTVIKIMGGVGGAEPATQKELFYALVAGMAGSVAAQSSATMVRGFATGEIEHGRMGGILGQEVLVGMVCGLVMGLLASLGAVLLQEGTQLPVAVALAILAGTTLAALAGTVVPALAQRIGVDPAVSAGPFLAAMNDVLGIGIFILIVKAFVS